MVGFVADFHPTLGPALFFIFACLSNTLFITVVVSILSTTFAELNQDAKAEVRWHDSGISCSPAGDAGLTVSQFMYRSAVGIFEGVKCEC
jgi:hypothetical protein